MILGVYILKRDALGGFIMGIWGERGILRV